MRLTRRKKLNFVGILVLALSFGIGLAVGFYSIFLATGTVNIGTDALQSLVDADAALLGFLGVITVFALTSYNESIRLTEEQTYRTELEHRGFSRVSSISDDPMFSKQAQLDALDVEYKSYKKRRDILESRTKSLRSNSRDACIWCVASGVSFVVSILSSLLSMGEVPTIIKFGGIYVASSSCVVGVFWIFIMVLEIKDSWNE